MDIIHIAYVLQEQAKKIGKVTSLEKLDILNIQLRAGESVPEHNTPNEVIIVVRSGEVLFTVEGEEQRLTKEELLIMKPLENHSLQAITDTDILVFKIH